MASPTQKPRPIPTGARPFKTGVPLVASGSGRKNFEDSLADDIAQFYDDPYGYVMYAFPWGQKGTPLENETGPDSWQREQLMMIANSIQTDPLAPIRDATASGHGIGKSTEVAWVILWAMSTRRDLAGWVTANTQTQLKSKTWRELAVWHKRAINGHWFNWTATRFYQVDNPETWGIDAIPWTEHNSEAFAGLHATHVLMIMDEGSGIAEIIFHVANGAMTTPRAMWFVYGNPTQNSGPFFDCFHKMKHRWTSRKIDARTCKMTNKEEFKKWEADYGFDSDYFRVRVRGEFPHRASNQLISSQAVAAARARRMSEVDYIYQPLHLGCDPARFGDDESVISARQGRKHVAMKAFRGMDNMALGAQIAAMYNQYRAEGRPMGAIFVDGIGLGSGVVDYLNMLGYPVIDVNVGKPAEDPLYYNKRVEMWVRLKEWLDAGADIIDDADLCDQLVCVEYEFTKLKHQLDIDSKDVIKNDKKLDSPDRAESIALTFSETYVPTSLRGAGSSSSFEPEY